MPSPTTNGVPPPFRAPTGTAPLAPAAVQATPGAALVTPGGGPRPGWPTHGTVKYSKDLLELLLLLLAVPWLVKRIVHNPRRASRAAANHHLGS